MIEEKRYICEYCNKIYLNKFDCIEHEKNCNIHISIKRITLYYEEYNNIFKIEICNYPNVICKDGKYELINGYSYPMSDSDLMFDKIHYNEAQKYIYTKDLSEENEKNLIKILIENEIKSVENKIKTLNLKYNLLNNKNSFKIENVENKVYYYK